MKNVVVIFISCLIGQSVLAEPVGYQLPTLREGVVTTRLAYNFWSGEYPGPVIDVTQDITIQAYDSVRTLDSLKSCTIQKGLYHPWSETKNSIDSFYSIIDIFSYEAQADISFADGTIGSEEKSFTVKKGEKIINEVYLSEGWCTATLLTADATKNEVYYYCEEVSENANFKVISDADPKASDSFLEQWMYLNCAEGYNAFIQDSALLAVPYVKEGQFLDYGKVGPAQD
jgi:hypothetical protein